MFRWKHPASKSSFRCYCNVATDVGSIFDEIEKLIKLLVCPCSSTETERSFISPPLENMDVINCVPKTAEQCRRLSHTDDTHQELLYETDVTELIIAIK